MSSEPAPLAAVPVRLAHPPAAEDALSGTPSRRQLWLLQSVWVPHALVILYLIAAYAVDLPNIDQWDGELPFLEKVIEGQAGLGDLISPHLEHRVATNRIIGWFVATFFGWNHRVECGFAWLLACGCAVNLCILAGRIAGVPMLTRCTQVTLMGALLFSLGQYASWTNCFGGIQWLSIEFYLTTGLVVAGLQAPLLWRFGACAALALFSTYSSSNGLLVWFLLLPPVLFPTGKVIPRSQLRYLATWGALAFLAIGGYFVGYERSDGKGPLIAAGLQDPVQFLTFFLANVGSPFAHGTVIDPATQSAIAGSLIVGLFAAALAYVIRHRDEPVLVATSIPWLMIGSYALGTGGAITLGRAADGVLEALGSRFLTTHVLTPIALGFLFPVLFRRAVSGRKQPGRSALGSVLTRSNLAGVSAALVTAVVILHVCYSVFALRLYPFYLRMFSGVKVAVLFVKCFRDESHLKWAWSKTSAEMVRRTEFLDAQGYLRPKLIRSAKVEGLLGSAEHGLGRSGEYGAIEKVTRPSQTLLSLGGWAVFPGRGEPADAVVLSWETGPRDATIFAIAQGGPPRDELASRLGNASYRWAGWTVNVDTRPLPKGELTIRAWALDLKTTRVFELNESYLLRNE
jgi:hypothetical protein